MLCLSQEIGTKDNVDKAIARAKDKEDSFRLMGFGHRCALQSAAVLLLTSNVSPTLETCDTTCSPNLCACAGSTKHSTPAQRSCRASVTSCSSSSTSSEHLALSLHPGPTAAATTQLFALFASP